MLDFEKVLPMVMKRAHQFTRIGCVGVEFDDLVQEGYIIFLEAVKRYNPDKGCAFSTWYYRMLTSRFTSKVTSFAMKQASPITDIMEDTVAGASNTRFHIQDLSNDAGYVCTLILDGVFTRLTKQVIREYLYEQDWKVKRVNATFKEIGSYIDNIC